VDFTHVALVSVKDSSSSVKDQQLLVVKNVVSACSLQVVEFLDYLGC